MAKVRAMSAPIGDGDAAPPAVPAPPDRGADEEYTVVARRYRPQRFEEVVGQDHVVRALRNAIRLDRVAQAYLFSGTRGVGKTSLARIFAKCLNCVEGPTERPCLRCDVCRAIAVGQDVDVIEIDGASNNGVEAVRELRQNAGLRPSRSRFKIYYIDEVHMLSTGAFNALLKTLEEPPAHVKFFFATTEANKIPITVLSRCQRFDFAGIAPEAIVETLAGICAAEGVEADPAALDVVARRAGGSMRDAQSLLEQLLSGHEGRLTAEEVYRLLGLAPDDTLIELLEAAAGRDAGRTLELAAAAIHGGVQPADLLSGLLDLLRDLMIVAAGAGGSSILGVAPSRRPRLTALAEAWGLDTTLAALQVLAEARARLRGSPHARLLVELALCRLARLENFAELGTLIAAISNGHVDATGSRSPAPVVAAASAEKKKPMTAAESPPPLATEPPPLAPAAATAPVDLRALVAIWPELAEALGPKLGRSLARLRPSALGPSGELALEPVGGPTTFTKIAADTCAIPENRLRIESELKARLGRAIALRIDRPEPTDAGHGPAKPTAAPSPPRNDEVARDPLVQKIVELFEARTQQVEFDAGPADG